MNDKGRNPPDRGNPPDREFKPSTLRTGGWSNPPFKISAIFRRSAELTPEVIQARWSYRGVSSKDQVRPTLQSGGALLIEETNPYGWGTLIVLPFLILIFSAFFVGGIYMILSGQDIFFGIFLILFVLLPNILFTGILISTISDLLYNREFISPCLSCDAASLVPGSTVMLHYHHLQKHSRRTLRGFVLSELVMATHTTLQSTGAEGPSDTEYQILWSSGIEVQIIHPNISGMTFEQVVQIPQGFPDAGPLPIAGKELSKEAVWYFRVCEVILPRASCRYEFILPVGRQQHVLPSTVEASQ